MNIRAYAHYWSKSFKWVYVCQNNLFHYLGISAISVQLNQEINLLR